MIKIQSCVCVWQFEGLMLLWQQGIVDLLGVIKVQLLSQWGAINSASGAVKGCKSNKPLLLIFILACWLQSWHPGAYYIIGYPSEMHLKLKFWVISLTHNLLLSCQIILKICTAHSNITAMLYAIFQNNLKTEMDVLEKEILWDMSLRWVWDRCPILQQVPGFIVESCQNAAKFIQNTHNTHQGPLLLTWFNFNPSMDK